MPSPADSVESDLQLLVRRTEWLCDRVCEFELVDGKGRDLPAFAPGAHVDVRIDDLGVRQYSLCNDAHERHRYVIAVLRQDAGRGGSRAMHERVRAGEWLSVSAPRNRFALRLDASHHVLIAGGIGITPLLPMARALQSLHKSFELHVCTRSPESTPYRALLARMAHQAPIRFVHDHGVISRGLDVHALLREPRSDARVYCCGPTGLMDAVAQACHAWPTDRVHFERFAPAPQRAQGGADAEFRVRLRSTGEEVAVPAGKSILQCLREHGLALESSCEIGICGTCEIRVLQGRPDHRDEILTPAERSANQKLMACVSRAPQGETLVLDL